MSGNEERDRYEWVYLLRKDKRLGPPEEESRRQCRVVSEWWTFRGVRSKKLARCPANGQLWLYVGRRLTVPRTVSSIGLRLHHACASLTLPRKPTEAPSTYPPPALFFHHYFSSLHLASQHSIALSLSVTRVQNDGFCTRYPVKHPRLPDLPCLPCIAPFPRYVRKQQRVQDILHSRTTKSYDQGEPRRFSRSS